GGGRGACDRGREQRGEYIIIPGAPAEERRVLFVFFPPAIVRALLAKALIVTPAIGAAAAADGALENDAIAFFYMVNRAGIFAELFDPAKNFMSENDGIIDFKLTVKVFDVGAANAAHLNLDQAAIDGNVRKRIFTNFQFVCT